MKLRKYITATAVVVAGGLVLSGCSGGGGTGGGADGSDGARGPLNLGVVGDVVSWDSSQAHVGHSLQMYQSAYDALLLRQPDGELAPMLATEWAYNEDNTVLTVDLRDDVTFSDGAVFDAEAAKANLDNFKTANGPQMAQLAAVSEVAVVDDDTIEIALSEPDPALTYYLSQAAGLMASPEALGTDEIKLEPVGSGPYVMDTANSVVGSAYAFTAREDYWNDDLQKFDSVNLKVLTDQTARLNALMSGQVDGALLDPKTGQQAEGAGKVPIISQVDWRGLLLLDRDGEMVPALADVRVRQALNYAFDRQTILDQLLLGHGTVTDQVFGEKSGAYVDELDGLYDYDPKKAKDLLKEAGYADGFTLNVPALPGYEALFAVMAQQLADIGVTLQVDAIPVTQLIADVGAGKFPAFVFQLYQGEPWVAINQMMSTDALYNPFDTTTPELQTMIDAVQYGADDSAELAKDVNRYVAENAWFVPLFRIDQDYYISDTITVEPQIQQAVPSIYNYAPAS